MEQKEKRSPAVVRRVDVGAVEMARLEKGLSIVRLCAAAKIDPLAYRNLLRHEGRRSRDTVILGVTRALDLPIREVLTISAGREEAA